MNRLSFVFLLFPKPFSCLLNLLLDSAQLLKFSATTFSKSFPVQERNLVASYQIFRFTCLCGITTLAIWSVNAKLMHGVKKKWRNMTRLKLICLSSLSLIWCITGAFLICTFVDDFMNFRQFSMGIILNIKDEKISDFSF